MATKKPIAKKAKTAPVKAAAKKVVAKPAAKTTTKKVNTPTPKKAAVKAVAKKAAAKSAPKPVAKKAVTQPAPKPAAKKIAPKPAPKPVAKKAVAKPAPKPVAKKAVAKPAPKPVAKKAAPKVADKKVVEKAKPAPEVKSAPSKKRAPSKPAKKTSSTKTIITSSMNNLPKKSDIYKTNTFGTPNLKNESGRVIAHRKTKDMKRKGDGLDNINKYEPEVTRSILDMTEVNNGPSFRYSDDDLMEFKELIQRKVETAKAELQYLQGVIMRKDEGGTEDTENKYQNMEDGSASMEREQFTQLASRQITFISHLEQALVRIENKTYGICRETGKLIDKARLRAVPHATLSIEAKNAKKN